MLRRMSIHAAGLFDDNSAYVCSNLSAVSFDEGVQDGFTQMNRAFREYAIAGTQHLDHMADLILPAHRPVLRRHSVLVGRALDQPATEVEALLVGMFERHAIEWDSFLKHMGASSFLRQWTRAE